MQELKGGRGLCVIAMTDQTPCDQLNSTFVDQHPDLDVRNCSIADVYGITWDEIHSKAIFRESFSAFSFFLGLIVYLRSAYIVAAVSPVLLLSTLGNGLILLILWKKTTVRNSVNIVIGNMAFADFFCCFIVTTIAVGRNMQHNYVLGEAMCQFDTFFKNVTMNVSDLSLVLLCYERLKVLWWPFLSGQSNIPAYVKCIVVWLSATGVYSWELFHYRKIGKREWAGNFTEVYCEHDGDHLYEEYFGALLGCYIPDILTTVLYVLFLWKIRQLIANSETSETDESAASLVNQWKYEKMVATMIVVNLVVSWVGWFPEQYLFLNPNNDFRHRVSSIIHLKSN